MLGCFFFLRLSLIHSTPYLFSLSLLGGGSLHAVKNRNLGEWRLSHGPITTKLAPLLYVLRLPRAPMGFLVLAMGASAAIGHRIQILNKKASQAAVTKSRNQQRRRLANEPTNFHFGHARLHLETCTVTVQPGGESGRMATRREVTLLATK